MRLFSLHQVLHTCRALSGLCLASSRILNSEGFRTVCIATFRLPSSRRCSLQVRENATVQRQSAVRKSELDSGKVATACRQISRLMFTMLPQAALASAQRA